MICPDCGHDNIAGVDACEACDQPLVAFDPAGSQLEQTISSHTIDGLCSKEPVIIPSTMTVRDTVAELVKRKIGCILVEDDGCLVGVFTERDVLNKVSSDLTNLDRPVSEFMTASPETLTQQDSIAYALHTMNGGGYRHVPIVDEHAKPTGIVSIRDILRFLCIRFGELRSSAG